MNEIKQFLTIQEQIELLKSRNLNFCNEEFAQNFLKKENYYNVINAYKNLFLDKSQNTEIFKSTVSFEEICELYIFDRTLRSIFLKYILEIENHIKSVLAYDFSSKYGHDNYLKIESFDITTRIQESKVRKADKIERTLRTITILQQEIARQLKNNNPMISHYILKYGYVPFWVLINVLSIGTISKFYNLLKDKDQNSIGREFLLKPPEMNSILKILTLYRNACAHDERLFNLKTNVKLNDNQIHKNLNISKSANNQYINGKNDLFALVIICKLMLSADVFPKLINEIKSTIEHLEQKIHSINIHQILKEMGFPLNWINITNI